MGKWKKPPRGHYPGATAKVTGQVTSDQGDELTKLSVLWCRLGGGYSNAAKSVRELKARKLEGDA